MVRTFTHELLEFEELDCDTQEDGRTYVTPNGNVYPSITTCLNHLSADIIAEWRDRIGHEEADAIVFQAANRGTALHSCVERYLNNKEIAATPLVRMNFNDIKPFIDKHIGIIYALEAPLYCDELGVAGRVDIIAEWDGEPAIIDIKTSGKPKREEWCTGYFMQEEFYAMAVEELKGFRIKKLVTVIAVDKGPAQIIVQDRGVWNTPMREAILMHKNG